MFPNNPAFDWFWGRSFGSKLQGRVFWIRGELFILIGFYTRPGNGVFLWQPFQNDTIPMRTYRFVKELRRKQLTFPAQVSKRKTKKK